MKLKKRRVLEVPPKIKSFINSVTAVPHEKIEESLKGFAWEYDKQGDFHHWVDLFNYFDSFFEKHIKSRKDLHIEDDSLAVDFPFPRGAVLSILRVIRIVLENCTNKHFYSSYEQHLSSLLASTDADIVEASLQTLVAFLKKTMGKCSIRDASLGSKLFTFSQGWGSKDEGLGIVSCAVEKGCDPVSYELGCTLHFEFYSASSSSNEATTTNQMTEGLQVIHLPNIHTHEESDLELLNNLVSEWKVPPSLRFSLLTRLRFARAFGSLAARQQYICIRLYAFVILAQASHDAEDLAAFFTNEPEFVSELVSLISYEEAVPEKIRILGIQSLVALCQDRSRQTTVLSAVTSGGHRGILASLMQKTIDSITSDVSRWSVVFAESLLSLVTVLVSSSSGCSALREAGFIPTLLPLLNDTDPQHLHLVSTAVHVLEAFMDYSNPAAALFRDLGGLDDTIARLKIEVSHVEEKGSKKPGEESQGSRKGKEVVSHFSAEVDNAHPQYNDALVAYHRRLLMKALLRAISLGTYAPGSAARIYGSEESLLPHCLCIIFRRAKDFGGGVFSLAATVMSDLIHKDPTCYPVLDAANLPAAFLDAIMDGILCSSEAVTCIPQCLDALCLNNSGLQAVKDHNALRCFVKIFTSKSYLHALAGDTPASLSTGLDELMRHASSLRAPGVDMLIEILNTISKIGSVVEASSSAIDSQCSSAPVPMETDIDEKNVVSGEDGEPSKMESSDQVTETSSEGPLADTESILPEYISNAARLLETILQNADTCRIFIEKKGVEAVLQIFNLPLVPLFVSIGHNVAAAFKNFSPQHSAALARVVCSFLRERLKLTNELLSSVAGSQIGRIESAKKSEVLRCLSSLEGLLAFSNSLLKLSSSMMPELGNADADVVKDLGRVYREIQWQISLSSDIKVEEKRGDQESGSKDASASSGLGTEDDSNLLPMVRYTSHGTMRNGSRSPWNAEQEFLSVVRSGEGIHRHGRHGLARIRGGRVIRHMESSSIDIEGPRSASESFSVQDVKARSPDVVLLENLNKLALTMRLFFAALVKGFTGPNRRRADSGSVSAASKSLATSLSKIFHEALSFSGHSTSADPDMSLSVKCRYLGKVVDDMVALTFDSKRRGCNTVLVNNFYVHGTFKELLTTFEATSQLLWTLPFSVPLSGTDQDKAGEEDKLCRSSWLISTLQSYCRMLEYFVNSALLLSPTSSYQAQMLVQPFASGLSIGLFPVPREPEVFVRMLQSQVLDVVLPVWNHPMFPSCSSAFISSMVSLITHIYFGVGDVKRGRNGTTGSAAQRFMAPPPDESTISTIVEMGFTRTRAVEALRRVETNSVEMAMEWLFSHAEDPVQEDDELARALALSLGSSSETSKEDNTGKAKDVLTEERVTDAPPVDDILASSLKLFQSSESIAFSLTDLLVTLCNRNKGEERPRVVTYLIQQLKLCPSDFSKDTGLLCTLSHILALLLSEDGGTRETAAENGIVSAAIDILTNFKARNESGEEVAVPKCISALLLILDNMLQSKPRVLPESTESMTESAEDQPPLSLSTGVEENKPASEEAKDKEASSNVFEKTLGKSAGYLTLEESQRVLSVTLEFIKQHVPAVVMQAVLQLCARLTKTHTVAMQFLENGGLVALFSLPSSCFFPGYNSVTSAIVRHLLEDPQTLQTAMELEIRQTISGTLSRHAGRLSPRIFLSAMAPVISRDPVVFMRATAAVCQLETSGSRINVVLSKEKEKEKDKSKTSCGEAGLSSNDGVRISENKQQLDGPGKCSKGHKKVPANLTQVIDQLLEIVMSYPSAQNQEELTSSFVPMEVDEPAMRKKGKSKVDDTKKVEMNSLSERSTGLAKVTFVLKLLSDILLMYVHAVGVILKRDLEICQQRGHTSVDGFGQGGVLYHILHRLLPLSSDKTAGTADERRDKLSEKASWFLVVLSGRSSEGRRRVINEIARALFSFSNLENNSSKNILLPNGSVLAFADLVNSILSKNSSSSNLPGPGCSPDIAKTMIDGGMIQSLTSIVRIIDLDHPNAPKVVNLIIKALESLTRVANASEQLRSDGSKKKVAVTNGRGGDQTNAFSAGEAVENNQNQINQQEGNDAPQLEQHQLQGTSNTDGDQGGSPDQSMEQDTRVEGEETTANPPVEHREEFVREEMEETGALRSNSDGIEMTFRVEHRADDEMGDEDDEDMGDDDEDDDDEDEEEEDIAEDGTALMSLADTDVEDHDDSGLGDEYNDEIIDEEDDEFHENRVIEVRWREGLDGLDHLQVLGRPGAAGGLIDVAAEPFQGVNVDDIFGLRRPLGVERRRQTANRTLLERSGGLDTGGFQHPLLTRPSQSGDPVSSVWSSSGNSSRDLESLQVGSFDAAHFYMFDAPVLTSDHASATLFGERSVGAPPPPLIDFSLGMDPLQHLAGGRRGPGDGRWTDDGQPQGSNQAAAIAYAVEDHFISQLRSVTDANNPPSQRPAEISRPEEKPQADIPPSHIDSQLLIAGDIIDSQQSEVQHQDVNIELTDNQENPTESEQVAGRDGDGSLRVVECMSTHPDALNRIPDGSESMEIGEDSGASAEQLQAVPDFVTSSDGILNLDSSNRDSSLQGELDYGSSRTDSQSSNYARLDSGSEIPEAVDGHASSVHLTADVEMDGTHAEENQAERVILASDVGAHESLAGPSVPVAEDGNQGDQTSSNNETSSANTIDPTFLEALPEDLRAEVLASQLAQPVQATTYTPPSAEDIDPEFLAALPPDIQAEVLAQQRAQRVIQSHQAEGQAADMDNASIIATFPADLREEVLLTSSEAVLSALPSPLLAEAQMLRDRAMSHYQARSLFGSTHRLSSARRNSLGFDRQTLMDRGVGVSIGRRTASAYADRLKVKEIEGAPLLDADSLKALVRLLRLAQPLGKGLLQRLLLNLCSHSITRANLLRLLLSMIKPEAEGLVSGPASVSAQRLYGCQWNVVYGRSQHLDGLPPLVSRRILEILTYLATNHPEVAHILFYFDHRLVTDSPISVDDKNDKGKGKLIEGTDVPNQLEASQAGDIPLILLLKLLSRPLFLRSNAHLEQVMGLLQVVVFKAALRLECETQSEQPAATSQAEPVNEGAEDIQHESPIVEPDSNQELIKDTSANISTLEPKRTTNLYDIFLQIPESDLRNICGLLAREGLSDKVHLLAAELVKKLASIAKPHRKLFTAELAGLAHSLSSSAVSELITLRSTNMLGLSAGSMAGAAILRVLQALSNLTSPIPEGSKGQENDTEQEELTDVLNLNAALEPLWQELSDCISTTEVKLGQSLVSSPISNPNPRDPVGGNPSLSPPLPPGTQRLLPFIEAFFVLCEKLQTNATGQQDQVNVTASEVKDGAGTSFALEKFDGVVQRRPDGAVTFARFSEKHRRLLNAFIRQNPGLLEKSLCMMLKAPRLIDFDNKRAYFRSRIRQHHEQHPSAPLRISVRRAYVLEDSYNQLRMRPTQDLKGRLTVQFQGEEGIDAGGLTREWYQLLSRVIFDKGALLFTTVGNNATFQPNANSVYQTEHLSYFKFVGRVVSKALFDGQLLDVYFTRSFYKHILGVKVTYHDIEAVDPDYYKNLKWMLENDVSEIPDLTFSMDADEEKHILYEKTEVTDYELKPGGRNCRVTEETKHEYVDLVAGHILTNAIRPQINSFLEGFNELVPRELISIFNDKELELLISGLPEIDLDDLQANAEYTGYSAASNVVQWFWEVVKAFSKEDMARLLQFVTGTSKVPLDGFKALQGISGPQRFQIHKAYGAPERLPSAHTCFNQLDLPEYSSKEQLQERLLLAIHEASEGFGFG
ncbi:E3 ubiquitin-protein ligase UPL1-like isoform X1 [Papaver somniferum]|uniref:E3 ubiquitin-protein ligase UPL1-like isoform X1 n=1 Tax=Papaver somniferum TaxID=3469 RepID=UPI000E6FC7DF|nr:E3 ubiquitin-protein ligase UPL1-like isoform X1 [Papaver somniferum]XP_026392927.1 E3 ubiquitin-protein ligase UPL1-like isoform X1 [Papaver somniferum]